MDDAVSKRLVRGVTGAPLTYVWLVVLFVTTRVQRSAGRRGARRLQQAHSTNLRRLRTEPSRVLTTSLFWLDGRVWWPYVPAFVALVAPAERRLRWWRWLLIGIAAHVIGTYVSQARLRRHIDRGAAPKRLADARDVGVSYFAFGVIATLAGYARPPWRRRSQVAGLAVLGGIAGAAPTYTAIGHLVAFAVGLAAVPLAPDRDGQPYPAVQRPIPHSRFNGGGQR
ncbi:hypothetical protein MMAD_09730 [Mycolicibacterium madagascariense]|uniref:Uncharacterized protein n=1 Tax=Mycolicibacterium madagascariense TaxID=212765 RepID=A0A7I7XDX3_9MYCO|nr:rhomboid-like protein [Mycolicibacterium madagascariense]MCV7011299.1 hypothetical protein [Mycolicibacterium madagascariense]BBZ26678.1 hypothetical protein MMAD_09730 [Mycolicibacterium madagascariense]